MPIVHVGLGSNLADPQSQVRQALRELGDLPKTTCLRYSSLYRSAPLVIEKEVFEKGVPEERALEPDSRTQPDYINAVAELDSELNPLDLLHELQHLETRHNRIRAERWGPRTLDLDILLYDDCIIESHELTVPHPGLYERNFVLYPLAEIAPDLDIPGAGLLRELLGRCERGSLEKLTH